MEYPQFLIAKEELCRKVNDTLKTIALSIYENFVESINEFSTLEMPQPFLNMKYTIEYFSGEIISLLFTFYEYTGGAHPNTYHSIFNLWLTDDEIRLLDLGDLFLQNTDYLKILFDICIVYLRNQNASFVIDGMVNNVSDMLDVFTLTPARLCFTFAPYSVDPMRKESIESKYPTSS